MKVIEIDGGSGSPEQLRLTERADVVAGAGRIRIHVRAAGVNRPDLLQRRGHYPAPAGAPDTMGLEVAGEVDQVGDGVTRWAVGDRVCALLGGGGYAQYAVTDARHALPIPAGFDMVHAAALPETVFTVYANVFEHGALKVGETLLIHGGTSGIGTTAIAMAKAAGAKVIATGRGADKKAKALELGADIAVDTKTEDFAEVARAAGGVDVVLDMVGASYFEKNLQALNVGGRIVYIAALAGPMLEVPVMAIMQKRATITGSTLRPRSADEKARLTSEIERVVWPWIAAGKLKPIVDATFPLEKAAKAHAHLETGEHVGKVMLVT